MVAPRALAATPPALPLKHAAGLLGAERRDVAAACAQLVSGGVVCAAGPDKGYVPCWLQRRGCFD
jgi:hypothetical protein